MVLSDIEIWAEVQAGRLVIDPAPNESRVNSSSVDLLLDTEIIALPLNSEVQGISVNPALVNVMDLIKLHGKAINITDNQPYRMTPGRLVIGKTLETIEIPNHLAARVEGKSSLARLGLAAHVTAPTVQSGFQGKLYLEMYNVGPFTLELYPRMDICQLVLEHVGLPSKQGYQGRFFRQT